MRYTDDMKKYGVGAVITNEAGEILLAKRGPQARDKIGKWESVGGGVDEGETPEQAIIREVREEIGVEAAIESKLFEHDSAPDPSGLVWANIVFKVSIMSGEPVIQEPEKCSELKWHSAEALKDLELTGYSAEDFRRLGWL